MALYYFHVRDGNNLIRDDDGIELPSVKAARAEAKLATREARRIAAMRGEAIGMHGVFEIADQSGQPVLSLTFEEALIEDVPPIDNRERTAARGMKHLNTLLTTAGSKMIGIMQRWSSRRRVGQTERSS